MPLLQTIPAMPAQDAAAAVAIFATLDGNPVTFFEWVQV
jgi:hypothetical protein